MDIPVKNKEQRGDHVRKTQRRIRNLGRMQWLAHFQLYGCGTENAVGMTPPIRSFDIKSDRF